MNNTDNLAPCSTDMMVNLIGNTDKLISSNKRWNYDDHRNDTCDNENDELDVTTGSYMRKPDDIFKNNDSKKSSERATYSMQDDKTVNTDTDCNDSETSGIRDTEKKINKKDLILLKLDMLRKLGELKQCGVHLSQNYNLDSDLDMMQYEYKLHHDIRSKQNSVQWMSHMLIGIVKGVEMANDAYNPFDIKIGGLSEKISSDMHNYYTVLGDIYEKYNQPGKQMSPEMRLLLMLSGAILSMQVNRAIPSILGGSSDNVMNDKTLEELRKKAENDSRQMNEKTQEIIKKQHDDATQRVTDLKMLQEKELENKKINNTDMKKFKENLILSSETPRDNDNNDNDLHGMTNEEIENIRKTKY